MNIFSKDLGSPSLMTSSITKSGLSATALALLTACGGGGGGSSGSKPEFNPNDPTSFAVTLGTPEASCVQPGKPDGASIAFLNLPTGMTYNPDTNCLVVSSDVVGTVQNQAYKIIQEAINNAGTNSRQLSLSVNSSPKGTPISKQIEPGKTTVLDLLEGITDSEGDVLTIEILSKSFQGTTDANCTDTCSIEELFGDIKLDATGKLLLTPKPLQGVLKITYTAKDGRGGKKEFTKFVQVADSTQVTAGIVDANFSGTDTNPTISPFVIGNKDVSSISAVGLPNGITIDPNTKEIKGTFIPKNGNGRMETYEVTFHLVLSSGAIVEKKVTWNFPTYFATSPLNTVTIGNNTVINLTPGTEAPLNRVVIDTTGLGFTPSGTITVTTTKDQPNNPGATVNIVNGKIVFTARTGAGSLSPIVHVNGRTIQINGVKG